MFPGGSFKVYIDVTPLVLVVVLKLLVIIYFCRGVMGESVVIDFGNLSIQAVVLPPQNHWSVEMLHIIDYYPSPPKENYIIVRNNEK